MIEQNLPHINLNSLLLLSTSSCATLSSFIQSLGFPGEDCKCAPLDLLC